MKTAQQPEAVRCHDADACAMGQRPCPSPEACGCAPGGASTGIAESEKENAARHYAAMAVEARAAAKCLQKSAELSRYCPSCGSVGEVPAGARDCCPDGSDAFMVPAKFAEGLRKGFMAALQAAPPAQALPPSVDLRPHLEWALSRISTSLGEGEKFAAAKRALDEVTAAPAQEDARDAQGGAKP